MKYSYKSRQTGKYVVCGDDAQYMNHSFRPTVRTTFPTNGEEDVGFAAHDIQRGEELTVDYRIFDEKIDFVVL